MTCWGSQGWVWSASGDWDSQVCAPEHPASLPFEDSDISLNYVQKSSCVPEPSNKHSVLIYKQVNVLRVCILNKKYIWAMLFTTSTLFGNNTL